MPAFVSLAALRLRFLLSFAAAALALGGCSSLETHREPGTDLRRFQRYFVETTLNDNHGLDGLLVAELKARGFTVESGPLTMMPPGTQAVVTYRDRWAWDFTSYMIELQLNVREVKSPTPLASTHYFRPSALTKTPAEMVAIATRALFGPLPGDAGK